ncbi:MAG: dienelactone hydrolase family protein [Gemmataceae bacterium]|nr:dienelactone hydrolase family protein [Gemmataceae bacterium]
MCLERDCPADGTDRRDFVVGGAAGLIAWAAGGGPAFGRDEKQPPTRVLDDPAVRHGKVTFKHNGKETFGGYLARPMADGVYPGVLVIAGNKITEEYIPNTCAALAVAGFVGLAPDVFHMIPEAARTNEEYAKYAGEYTELNRLDDVQVGVSYLRAQPFVSPGGLGVVGFCRGGRDAMLFAARSREVDAVVAFHPAPMAERELDRLVVPVQVHHGTADGAVPHKHTQELERVLWGKKRPVEVFLYEKLDHGFLAYTRPFYAPEAAQLAWKRTTGFLGQHLKKG